MLRKVKEMMDVVQAHAPQAAAAIGVDIKDIKAASLRIADIVATGTASGVIAQDVDVSGSFVIEGVRVGESGADPSKKS
jgi:wobble nucleotide-excising tRNase